jgi:diacylglycerol kinase family enzyme
MQVMKRRLGDLAWVLASLRYGFTFNGSASYVQFDDVSTRGSMWLLSVNKVDNEGGMPVTPFARLDDGHLAVCLVPELGILRKVQLLVSLQRSAAHIQWPEIDYFSAVGIYNRYRLRGLRTVTVEPDRPLPVHLNGEFVGYTPATFELLPSSQAVLGLAEGSDGFART